MGTALISSKIVMASSKIIIALTGLGVIFLAGCQLLGFLTLFILLFLLFFRKYPIKKPNKVYLKDYRSLHLPSLPIPYLHKLATLTLNSHRFL